MTVSYRFLSLYAYMRYDTLPSCTYECNIRISMPLSACCMYDTGCGLFIVTLHFVNVIGSINESVRVCVHAC